MIDGFALGPLYIRFYGIILMLGAVAGGWLASQELKRRGLDTEMVWDLLVYLIIGGVIGARLWHIFTPPPSSIAQGFTTAYYLTHPLDAIAIWKGGLGIPGTILGGLVALYVYTRNNKTLSFLGWADIAAPSLALGQAIGRWGNFFNQELYGAPTNLPWKIYIDPAHRLTGFENVSFYHPLFGYESLLNLANMLLLLWLLRNREGRLKVGDVFNVYLIAYPLIRFCLDFLRLDASQVASVNINQTIMAVVGTAAIVVLLWRHRPGVEMAAGEPRVQAESQAELPAARELSMATTQPRSTAARKVTRASSKRPAAKKTSAKKAPSKKSAASKKTSVRSPARKKTASRKAR
jgi:phosphatidylglycerol---prolipoprotein diacylglyceryl transferase